MLAAWMLYAIAVAAVLSAAAAVFERALRVVSRPARGIWLLASLASLFAPLVVPRAPDQGKLESPLPSAPTLETPAGQFIAVPTRVSSMPLGRVVRVPVTLAVLDRPLAGLWLLSSVVAAALLALGALRLRRLRRDWRETVVDGVQVFLSDAVGPGVVGLTRPRVVLPRWALALMPQERSLMLAHEREHLSAGDSRLTLAAASLTVLMPWNPLLWWQLRRLRLATEIDCDARVLSRNRNVTDYGTLLLRVAEQPTNVPLMGAALLEPPSFLEERIMAMTAAAPPRRALRAAALVVAGFVLIALACEAPQPQAPADARTSLTVAPGCSPDNQLAITSQVIRERVTAFLAGAYPVFPDAWASQPTVLAFVSDHQCVILDYRAASRAPGSVDRDDYKGLLPHVDQQQVQSVIVLGAGGLGVPADSVAVLWVRLRDPRRPNDATQRFMDVFVRPVLQDAIQRHYPGLLQRPLGRGMVDVWFLVNDQDQRVLRTDSSLATGPMQLNEAGIVKHWPDIRADQINGWTQNTLRPAGHSHVRIQWVKFRPGGRAPQRSESGSLELGRLRRLVEQHHPDMVARPPTRLTAVWFLVGTDEKVVGSRVMPTQGRYGIEEARTAFPDVGRERIGSWHVVPLDAPLARAAGVAISNTHVVWVRLK